MSRSSPRGRALTVDNSPPAVALSGGGTYQVAQTIQLGGSVADFDGDTVSYQWGLDGSPLAAGRGTGRTYSVAVTATDPAGNASTAGARVVVPHDRGH